MKDNSLDELKEIYRQAAEIASEVPESMQEAAFNKAVEHLTGYATVHPIAVTPGIAQIPLQPLAGQSPVTRLDSAKDGWQDEFNSVGHPEVSEAGTVLDKSLHILSIARKDHGIDQLSPGDIATILSDKYRIPARANQISDKLGKVAGRLVERRKVGKGFEYKIMLPGEQHLAGQSPLKKSPRKSAVRSSSPKGKSSDITDGKKNGSKSRSRSGRPGYKKLLTDLLSKGFFDEARTIADITTYATKHMGYTYKTNELSTPLLRLMRDGQLKREERDNGQWEYTKV